MCTHTHTHIHTQILHTEYYRASLSARTHNFRMSTSMSESMNFYNGYTTSAMDGKGDGRGAYEPVRRGSMGMCICMCMHDIGRNV